MVELFKLAMAKPLHAVVLVLCLVSMALSTGLLEVKMAMAMSEVHIVETEKTQLAYNEAFLKSQKDLNGIVAEMKESLIRVDENVNIIKLSRAAEATLHNGVIK